MKYLIIFWLFILMNLKKASTALAVFHPDTWEYHIQNNTKKSPTHNTYIVAHPTIWEHCNQNNKKEKCYIFNYLKILIYLITSRSGFVSRLSSPVPSLFSTWNNNKFSFLNQILIHLARKNNFNKIKQIF